MSYVKRVMSIMDVETRHGLGVTLEELNETLDRVAALLPVLSIKLRQRIEAKYTELS